MMLGCLFWGAGLLLVLYWLVSTLSVGLVGFTNVLLAVGVLLAAVGTLDLKYGQLPAVRKAKKVLLPVLAAGLVCFAVLEALIIAGAARKDDSPADYILVLGAGLRGEEPSLTLIERLDLALESDSGGTFVVSGGQGPNEAIPEAEAMARYLEEHGVSPERIIREDRSTSTMENLRFSRELIEADSGRDIASIRVKIISSDFHAFRVKMLARRAGYAQAAASGSATPAMVAPSSYIREVFALIKSFLFDR